MAAARTTTLLVLLSGFIAVYCIKDGAEVSQCDYPGVVALLSNANNVVICNGVRVNGALYLPEICGAGVEEALKRVSILMVYGDGTKNVTILSDSKGTLSNGVYKMTVSTPGTEDCDSEAVLYDKNMDISVQTCQVVGYGAGHLSAKVYDGILKATNLTKSTSAPCCRVIFESLSETEKGTLIDPNVPFNCGVSSGAACGTGDLGAPVYCKKSDGSRVVIGLVASAPCETQGTFLLHDLTAGSNLKFGVAP